MYGLTTLYVASVQTKTKSVNSTTNCVCDLVMATTLTEGREGVKVKNYHINISCLLASMELCEQEIMKTIIFAIAFKRVKYLGSNC